MFDILPSLNNFSMSLENISEELNTNSEISNELPFIDISPLLIPPPPEEDKFEVFENKDVRKRNIIVKNILDLQKSINDKLDVGNELLKEQTQSIKLSQSQTTIILPDILPNFENIPSPQLVKYRQDINREQDSITDNDSKSINLQTNSFKFPKVQNLDLNFDLDNLPKIQIDDIKIGFDLQKLNLLNLLNEKIIKIPVIYETEQYDLQNSKQIDVVYKLKKESPNLGDLEILQPKFDLPNYETIEIPLKTKLDLDRTFNQKDFSNLVQKIDYIQNNKVLEFRLNKIGYEFDNPPNIDFIPKSNVVIETELNQPNIDFTKFQKYIIPIVYDSPQSLDLQNSKKITVPVLYEQINKLLDPTFAGYKKNLDVKFDIQSANFQNIEKLLPDDKNLSIDITTEKTKNSLNNIPTSISEFQNKIKIDFETTKITNRINQIEDYIVKDGYGETISNVSKFLDRFIDKFDDLNSFKLTNPYEQITLKSIKNDENSKELVSNVDLSKLSSINKSSIPSVMMSTMDPKQFNSLMDTLEQNSKVISENIKDKGDTEKVSTIPVMGFNQQNQQSIKNKNEDKLLEVMSSLDEKMSIMISALSNISSWANENRTTSTSLRHYKH